MHISLGFDNFHALGLVKAPSGDDCGCSTVTGSALAGAVRVDVDFGVKALYELFDCRDVMLDGLVRVDGPVPLGFVPELWE